MNIKKELRKVLMESKVNKPINLDKLIDLAKAIEVICNGEYGITYYNDKENKIFIMLGDANPFDEEPLIEFIKEKVKNSYEDYDNIDVEIELEAHPTGEGWKKFNGKKFI